MKQDTYFGSISDLLFSQGYIAIPLRQNIAGQLLINARINGVDGIYILDSGAGHTVIDIRQADRLKLTVSTDETVFTGGGVGAHSLENTPSYHNRIEIGDLTIENFVVAVMSLETAWESLAMAGAKEELTGIIGVDLLKDGKAIIDFNAMMLYLQQH